MYMYICIYVCMYVCGRCASMHKIPPCGVRAYPRLPRIDSHRSLKNSQVFKQLLNAECGRWNTRICVDKCRRS